MARHHYETLQQVFDDAYRGLAAQGFVCGRLIDENGQSEGCAYRGSNGTRCAIGHCIPDDRYSPRLEGYTAIDIPENVPGLFAERISTHDLSMLQSSHDGSCSPEQMKRRLAEFATSRNLTIPSIEGAA